MIASSQMRGCSNSGQLMDSRASAAKREMRDKNQKREAEWRHAAEPRGREWGKDRSSGAQVEGMTRWGITNGCREDAMQTKGIECRRSPDEVHGTT